jgi:hypothetical protein
MSKWIQLLTVIGVISAFAGSAALAEAPSDRYSHGTHKRAKVKKAKKASGKKKSHRPKNGVAPTMETPATAAPSGNTGSDLPPPNDQQ